MGERVSHRLAVWLVAVSLLLPALAGCGAGKTPVPGVTDTTVKVGSFMALSGAAAALGVPIRKGLEASIKSVNDQGGVNGRKIELLVEDDGYDPAKAVAVTKKLVEQDRVFLVGPALGTAGTLAVVDYLVEQKVPFVHPMTGVSKHAYPVKPTVFAVQPTYPDEAAILTRYAREKLGGTKVAVLYHNSDYGKEGLAGVQKEAARDGMSVVYSAAHESKDMDFSSPVLKAKEAGADTVIIYALLGQTAAILKEAQKQGLKANFLTSYPNLDGSLLKLAGPAAEGLVTTGWIAPPDDKDPKYQKFVDIYKKYNNGETPSALASAGFVAGEIIVEGLKRAGRDLTREGFSKAMQTLQNFSGLVTPPITYTSDNHSGVTSLRIFRAKGDNFVPVSDPLPLH